MIQVTENQLSQVEYLIDQSVKGNHVLFDTLIVRRIFQKSGHLNLKDEDAYAAEPHIEKLILKDSIEQKKAYLDTLDEKTYELVVKTYFSIVENHIFENLKEVH